MASLAPSFLLEASLRIFPFLFPFTLLPIAKFNPPLLLSVLFFQTIFTTMGVPRANDIGAVLICSLLSVRKPPTFLIQVAH